MLERLLNSEINGQQLEVVASDPINDNYRYTFNLIKGMYYILNKEQKVIYYKEPINYELEFVFYVSASEGKAYIVDIFPGEITKRE